MGFTEEIPQREDRRTDGENIIFQDYIDRNDAELRKLHAIMHMATSAGPDIEETMRIPFTNRIAGVRLSTIENIKFPKYSGSSDSKAYIRAFRLAISRVHLNDDEKEARYYRFFEENFTGSDQEWFAGL